MHRDLHNKYIYCRVVMEDILLSDPSMMTAHDLPSHHLCSFTIHLLRSMAMNGQFYCNYLLASGNVAKKSYKSVFFCTKWAN